MPIDDSAPILVVVKNKQCLCFGLARIATERDQELARILIEDFGGVAETVADGRYFFNVEIIEGLHAYCTLEPVQ